MMVREAEPTACPGATVARRCAVAAASLALTALSAAGFAGCSHASPRARIASPNIILVTIDTLRADHVGSYGYRRPTTPNLDRFAKSAVRFADAVSVSSWTLPAHASLMTGLYPPEHGVQTDLTALPGSPPTLAAVLAERGYRTFAAVSHVYVGRRWGMDRGFQDFDESAAKSSTVRAVAGRVVDSALAWIAAHADGSRPSFVWLHIFDPHWAYVPPPPMDTMFDPDYRGSMRGDYASLKPYIKAVAKGPVPPLAPADLAHVIALYDGEIAYVDRELGRFFAALKEQGLFDDAMIVVTSDHGEEFMEHGSLEGHQWTLFDEVLRVPLLTKFPAAAHAGMVVERQVSTVGVAGMILDYVGADLRWRSLMASVDPSLARSPDIPPALLDLVVRHKQHLIGLRTPGFKLLRDADGRMQLFEDPASSGETTDVADAHPERLRQMAATLDRLEGSMTAVAGAGGPPQIPMNAITRQRLKATGYLD